MGKKQKEDIPNLNAAANKDILQRLNFLYQASVYLQSLDGVDQSISGSIIRNKEAAHIAPPIPKMRKRKETRMKRKRMGDLAREYVHCMREVAQKTTVKMCVHRPSSGGCG
jgi:ribonuclease P protein subunit RPR2